MNDTVLILLIAVIVIIIIMIISSSHKKKALIIQNRKKDLLSELKRNQQIKSSTTATKSTGTLESVFFFILLSVLGIAAYKLLKSGKLQKLLSEFMRMDINLRNQTTTIGNALKNEPNFMGIIGSSIKSEISENDFITHLQEDSQEPLNLAGILRDAVQRRIIDENI